MPPGAAMQGSVTIGRVWGIPIGLHYSWFLVFGLISWSLAGGYFPEQYPGWTAATYVLVGAAASLLFFGSVLVHELGHSWVALRNAIPIRSITLFIFGGIARIGREPNSHLRGLLTLHEVKAVPRERWGEMRVDEIMTRPDRLATLTAQEDLVAALAKMDDANVAQMPVVAGDEPVGMLSREHVLHYVRVRAELGV